MWKILKAINQLSITTNTYSLNHCKLSFLIVSITTTAIQGIHLNSNTQFQPEAEPRVHEHSWVRVEICGWNDLSPWEHAFKSNKDSAEAIRWIIMNNMLTSHLELSRKRCKINIHFCLFWFSSISSTILEGNLGQHMLKTIHFSNDLNCLQSRRHCNWLFYSKL